MTTFTKVIRGTEVSLTVVCTLCVFWILYLIQHQGRNPGVESVTLVEAKTSRDLYEPGEIVDITYLFMKNRDDCNDGHVVVHAWNTKGEWIPVKDEPITRRAPMMSQAQNFDDEIPLVDVENGEPVPEGVWSLSTLVMYDCPVDGEFVVLDDDISTAPFEIVAASRPG